MLARLSQGEANVSDLARPFLDQMSLPAVTKHLKVLESAGLVTKTRSAQWRPCTLNGAALRDAADWMETYRRFWEESFDRLDLYLKTVTATATATATVTTSESSKKKPKGKRNARKK